MLPYSLGRARSDVVADPLSATVYTGRHDDEGPRMSCHQQTMVSFPSGITTAADISALLINFMIKS